MVHNHPEATSFSTRLMHSLIHNTCILESDLNGAKNTYYPNEKGM